MRIAVLGVGLIGGSIGLAAREHVAGAEVVGFDREPERLDVAIERGADRTRAAGSVGGGRRGRRRSASPARRWARCPSWCGEALDAAGEDTVVTDVGSTKQDLASARPRPALRRRPPDRRRGDAPGWSTLAPTCSRARSGTSRRSAQSGGLLYERLHGFVVAFGASPIAVDAETHDRLLAVLQPPARTCSPTCWSRRRPRRLSERGRGAAARGAELPRHDPRGRSEPRRSGPTSTCPTRGDRRARSTTPSARARRAWQSRCGPATPRGSRAGTTRARRPPPAARGRISPARPSTSCASTVPNRPGIVAQVALALGQGGGEHRRHGARAGIRHAHRRDDALDRRRRRQADRAEALIEELGFPVARGT